MEKISRSVLLPCVTMRRDAITVVGVACVDAVATLLLWLAAAPAWRVATHLSSLPTTLALLGVARVVAVVAAALAGAERTGAGALLAAHCGLLGAVARRAGAAPMLYVAAWAFAAFESAALVAARARSRRRKKPSLEEALLSEEEEGRGPSMPSSVEKAPPGVRRILEQSRPEWPAMAGATLALLCAVLAQAALPVLFGRMVDAVGGGGSDEARLAAFGRACLKLGGVLGCSLIFTAVRAYVFNASGQRVVARLRGVLFERMLAQETAYFDAHRTGDLLNRLSSDTTKLQAAATETVSMALRSAVSALVSLALLFYTSPRLTAVALSTVPPMVGVTFVCVRIIKRLSKRYQAALADAGAVAAEVLGNARVARSFGAEEYEVARYVETIGDPAGAPGPDSSLAVGIDLAGVRAVFVTCTAGFGYASVLGVWYYGGVLVIRGAMTTGELVAFVMLLLSITASLAILAQTGATVSEALGASAEIFRIIDRDPAIPSSWRVPGPDVYGREDAPASVEFRAVVFAYSRRPDAPVLLGCSLRVDAKCRAALVGPSGAGKTTLLHLLLRFYDVQGGQVLFDGRDVRTLEPRRLRRRLALVAQNPALFSGTIAENIAYAARVRGEGTPAHDAILGAARAARVAAFAEQLPDGYATVVGERGVALSGGQIQRVAIARALLAKPRVLLFDEATSALDAEAEALVQEAIDRLCVGRSSLTVAHRLSTVVRSDVIALVRAGAVVAADTHGELLKNCPEYANLVRKQLGGAAAADGPAAAAPRAPSKGGSLPPFLDHYRALREKGGGL